MTEDRDRSIRSRRLTRAAFSAFILTIAAALALLSPPSASAASFVAGADAYVDSGSPGANFGTSTSLRFDASPTVQRTFIRFSASGITTPVTSAILRFVCTNGGPGGTVWTVSGSWTEPGLTWNNQPSLVSQVASGGALTCDSTTGTAVEYDVTSVVTGNGTYDFALTTTSGDGIRFRSRELTNSAPRLFIDSGPSGSSSTVDQVHLSWTENPATTMTVMWHTPSSARTATVQFGPDTSYGFSATGTTSASTGSGFLRTVTLRGLTPGTLYHYRVSADDGSWSGDRTFQTAPSGSSGTFRFLAAADMGTPRSDGKHLNSVAVSNAMAARTSGLAFTVGAGDYWYAIGADDEATVDQWFKQNEPFMSLAPFMPSFGNHEKDTSKRYYTRLSLPAPENYFSFRYGGSHFLVIDTNVAFTAGSAQRNFIESDLRAAASDPSVNWIFAVFHHPPFASSSTFQNLTARSELSPLFDRWGMDVVITGHAHFYERTFPVRANGSVTSTDPSQYADPGAPIYMVTGGGGADPKSSCSATRQAWSVTCRTVYEFLEVNVSPTRVQLSALGTDGLPLDGFTLQKAAAPSSGGNALVFAPADDAYVRSDSPNSNFGAATSLQVDNSPVKQFLLKFAVSGIGSQQVVSAKLRLFCVDNSDAGGAFHRAADTGWTEETVTWNNAPAADAAVVASLVQVTANTWYEVDVTPLIAGDGTISLRVTSSSSNGADYSSKEGPAANAPQLIVSVSSP